MRTAHATVLTLLAVLNAHLDLPLGTLVDLHKLHCTGGDQARITHAPPVASDVITLGEHTDFGSITILFNQLGGLQVMNPSSREWKYVRPIPGSAIVNLGDALVKLAGKDRLYSGLHRVVGPPGEQAGAARHSVVYFARPNGDVKLRSLFGDEEDGEGEVLTADEWIKQRARLRNKANFEGAKTFEASRGTEHHVNKAGLDRPAAHVEVV